VISGSIVGSQKEEIAQSEEFLWRLAFNITRLKAVSKELHYLNVVSVNQVSNLITNVSLLPEWYPSEAIHCVDGVTVSPFAMLSAR
jgi:hypothetical protein